MNDAHYGSVLIGRLLSEKTGQRDRSCPFLNDKITGMKNLLSIAFMGYRRSPEWHEHGNWNVSFPVLAKWNRAV